MLAEEKTVISQAQKGDTKAFEVLVNEYYEVIFKMAFKWCNNAQDAEDITQDACIKLAKNLSQFRFESAFSSWLYRLTLNCAKDFYKKNNKHMKGRKNQINSESNTDKTQEENASYTYNCPEKTAHTHQVLSQINRLPDNEKSALILVFAQGLTHKEAAQILDCKESTISWYIHEARKKLNNFVEKDEAHG